MCVGDGKIELRMKFLAIFLEAPDLPLANLRLQALLDSLSFPGVKKSAVLHLLCYRWDYRL